MRLGTLALLAAGCGRIGFDATGDGPGADGALPVPPVPLADGGLARCIEPVWNGQELGVFLSDGLLSPELQFVRVARDGSILGSASLFATAGECPPAVWTGASYALTWSTGDIELAIVDSAGVVKSFIPVAAQPENEVLPAIAWDGAVLGISYLGADTSTTRFRPYAADGTPLGAAIDVASGDFTQLLTALPAGGFGLLHGPSGAPNGASYVELDQGGRSRSPTTTRDNRCSRSSRRRDHGTGASTST